MRVAEILSALPASLDWAVLFRLEVLRPLANDARLRQMFMLPLDTALDGISHAVLTSAGGCLAARDIPGLRSPHSDTPLSVVAAGESLMERHAGLLSAVEVDAADCLGLGQEGDASPVLLHLRVADGRAEGTAVFRTEPSGQHYELLRAVGVEYLGGSTEGEIFLARFVNRLPAHLDSGALAGFARTLHCVQFFLQQGEIDAALERGLLEAMRARVVSARARGLAELRRLALAAIGKPLSLVAHPPDGPPFDYGDVLPLGIILRALREAPAPPDLLLQLGIAARLTAFLLDKRQDGLWSYHSGGLVTSTDSAFALLGIQDATAIDALERFSDGRGGYVPQICSTLPEPGSMLIAADNQHWCQSDYATTCMVRARRIECGLAPRTSVAYLESGFEERSGLFFANPYLLDWALASALGAESEAQDLKARLRRELLRSMNPDYSFGRYDVALSSACAILALAQLGCNGRTLALAQLALAGRIGAQGAWPEATPFYSSLEINPAKVGALDRLAAKSSGYYGQLAQVGSHLQAITLYADAPHLITTSLAVMALSEPAVPRLDDIASLQQVGDVHRRYTSASPCEYIARFALPPYVRC